MQRTDAKQLRNRIIKYGVDNNYSAVSIDHALKKRGLGEYNPLTSGYNWSKALSRTPENAIEFGKDALTFGGMLIKPAMDTVDALVSSKPGSKIASASRVINKYANDPTVKRALAGAGAGAAIGSSINKLGAIPGALVGGILAANGPKEFVNAQLAPYNTSVDKFNKTDWRDVVQGAQLNPVYTGLDFATLGGGKLIGGISKTAGNMIPNTAPEFVRQLLPSKEIRDLNRSLTSELGNAKAKSGKNYDAYGVLESTIGIDRTELAKHIMTGKSNLKGKHLTLANGIRDSLKKNEKVGIDLGLIDPTLGKADVVSQYVMQFIPKSYNLLHSDFRDIILGNELRPTASRIIKDNKLKGAIDQLIKDGKELYDKDGIALLTQKFATTTDPLHEVIARDRNLGKTNYFDVSREIGRATPEELGRVLDDSIKFQLDQISLASEFEGILDNVIHNNSLVRHLSPEEISTIKSRALKEISKDIQQSEMPNLNKALAKSGIKDVFVDPIYYKSLNNLFKKPINAGMRRVLSQFKKNVLGTPHWVALNRAGNWTNNLIEGVGLLDYIDTQRYKKYIPDQLKQQTSFSSYLNEGLENATDSASSVKRGTGSTLTVPTNKIISSWNKYKSSNKGLENASDLATSLYANVNDYIANPFFRLEATLELQDRYANFIRQAKRRAIKEKTTVENILKKAQTDNKLFHELNTQVNKSLGDYVGRNYALPAGMYNVLSELVPFYRFYTQTLRTTAHQLANHPERFQAAIQIPNKVGREKSEEILNKYRLNQEWYKGGVPYGIQGNSLRTMGLEPLPIQTVIELLGEIGKTGEVTSLLNPVISSLAPALEFRKFGKPATTPRQTAMKRMGLDVSKFEPTLEERLRYILNSGLSSTSALYNMRQRILPEALAPWNGGIQTRYDTHPFTPIPGTYTKKLSSETIFKQFGVKTNANYKKKPKSRYQIKKEKKNARYQRKNENRSKLPLRRI